jgi:putative flippase GtrA
MTDARAQARSAVWPELGAQGGRFAAVGIAATLTHVLIVTVLIDGLDFRIAGIANGFGALAGSLVSYCGNYFWTFRSSGPHLRSLIRFVAAYGAVSAFNGLIMFAAADMAGVPYLLPLLFSVAATPLLTFLLNRFWVFA